MKYKYCFLAAGAGHRNFFSKNSHKALLPLDNRTVLSLLLEKLDPEIPIVMAIGHNGELLQEYMSLVHPDHQVTFITIDKIEGQGAGPGYSLLQCKSELMCPFVLLNCDSYIEQMIPPPIENWMGVCKVPVPDPYCLLGTRGDFVEAIMDKPSYRKIAESPYEPDDTLNNAFTGLAGIFNYETFWDGLGNNPQERAGELQVSNGFESLIPKNLKIHRFFQWLDTGTDKSYSEALERVGTNQVLLKPEEFIYFEKNKVVKFFVDPQIIKNRVYRATKLKGIVPEILNHTNHFYTYEFVPGKMLSEISDIYMFRKLLEISESTIFAPLNLDTKEERLFKKKCKEFYFNKTHKRLEKYYQIRPVQDREHLINGLAVPKLSELLKEIDWERLSDGTPTLFHGDFQPENIICSDERVTFIDWRQDFNGELEFGDLYYDFAKLYHALILNGSIIRKNEYIVKLEGGYVELELNIKSNLLEFLFVFENYLKEKGHDLYKVKILSALIYFNIAPLHHTPYSELLYFLGKRFLYNILYSKGVFP